MARILVISCTTYGQDSRVKCHADALVGHGDEVDVLCLENQRSVRSNGVNLIGLVRPRHRRTGSVRGLCYVQFSISAAFNAVRFSLRRRYDVVVVYAMRTATILCAAPLTLLGSRITLDLDDETADAHQKEKAGRQGALRARLLVMEEAIRARFANRAIVAHAIHRQLFRNLKIFGSGASNTTRILRSGIPACSEGSGDSLGWDHQQRQLLEAVDSLLEKETEARPASESSSGVGWRSVEWLRHGGQIGWVRSNPWRAEKSTLVLLRSTDIVPAQSIVLELADAISSVHALAFPAYSACLPDLRLPDIVGKLRDTTLGWGHRLDVAGAVRQVFKRWWPQGNAMPMPGCRHCTIQPLSPIARFCTRCGSPLLGSRASVVKDDVVRRIVVLCKAGSQLVTSMRTRLRITTLNVASRRRAVNAMAWLVKSPHPGGWVASIKTCARYGAKRMNPQARFCTECEGCIAKEMRGRGSLAGPAHPAGDRAKEALRPRHRRELGRWTQTVFALSTRRVSELMLINRSTMNYRSRRDPQHALRVRLRELAASRVRFGYRRLTVMLRREGWPVNAKRIYRLYTEDGLAVRTKVRKKITRRSRVPALRATGPNERWSMDFVAAQLLDGRWFRVLTVVDQFTRECLLLLADSSLTGQKLTLALSQAIAERGAPVSITVDNGTEFACKAMDVWAYQYRVHLDFIRPGKPLENSYIESFNGRLRDECLNVEVFFTLADVRDKLERWRQDYNQVRPHSALRDNAPALFAMQWAETATPDPEPVPVQAGKPAAGKILEIPN